jgi:hypothetical protein
MKITVEIDCSNAAFGDTPGHAMLHVRHIFCKLAKEIDEAPEAFAAKVAEEPLKLRDVNGNQVGFFRLSN